MSQRDSPSDTNNQYPPQHIQQSICIPACTTSLTLLITYYFTIIPYQTTINLHPNIYNIPYNCTQFQPNTYKLKPEIEDIVVESINFWLPYILIDSIDITTAEDDPNLPYQIRVSILYSVQNFEEKTITIFANNDNTLSVV